MDAWSNIEVSPDDREILSIEHRERTLGSMSEEIYKIRELITRFEVCHFKYQKHYRYIIKSITELKPAVDTDSIGANHLRHGEKAPENDTTGRSRVGRQYIAALCFWLEQTDGLPDDSQNEMNRLVALWLGERNAVKKKLVNMLLDRLLYRLEGYNYCKMTELEYQVMRTDICCYAFPRNIEKTIRAIGKLSPVETFDGCGTTNAEIKLFAGRRLKELCQWLKEDGTDNAVMLGKKNPVRIWLTACLAKTIKEQIQALDPIPDPPL
jgi:hypothetical protein